MCFIISFLPSIHIMWPNMFSSSSVIELTSFWDNRVTFSSVIVQIDSRLEDHWHRSLSHLQQHLF